MDTPFFNKKRAPNIPKNMFRTPLHRIIVFTNLTIIECANLHFAYSNSSHRSLISMLLIAFTLLIITIFARFAGIILTDIKIVLKMYSH